MVAMIFNGVVSGSFAGYSLVTDLLLQGKPFRGGPLTGALIGGAVGVAGSLLESACDQLPNPLPKRVHEAVLPLFKRMAPVLLLIKKNLFAIMPFGIALGIWFTSSKIILTAFSLGVFYGITDFLTPLAQRELRKRGFLKP
jgi:hypothetical protein